MSARTKVQEVKVEKVGRGGFVETKYTHPAFAKIGVARVSSSQGYALHGSDFGHRNFIVLKIHRADLTRGLSQDYHFANQLVTEVAMSEAQWATMISSLNMGDGVPCTLQFAAGDGEQPRLPQPRGESEEFAGEVKEKVEDAIKHLNRILEDNPKLKKSVVREIEMARQSLEKNIPFVVRSFDEHYEATTEKAKIEIEAFLSNAVRRAGLEALGGVPAPLVLGPGEEDG